MTRDPRVRDAGPSCPLCGTLAAVEAGLPRTLRTCSTCLLLFKDPATWLTAADERARYALHDNRADDPRYVAHLRRLADPVIAATVAGARGLDFGCGPAPVLADIIAASGRPTASYDPHFFPAHTLLATDYDFITCSEVLEHVREPLPLLNRLRGMLHRDGVLAIMTGLRDDVADVANWWYLRDPTHICFYSRATFAWIGARCGFSVASAARDVVLLRPGTGSPNG